MVSCVNSDLHVTFLQFKTNKNIFIVSIIGKHSYVLLGLSTVFQIVSTRQINMYSRVSDSKDYTLLWPRKHFLSLYS